MLIKRGANAAGEGFCIGRSKGHRLAARAIDSEAGQSIACHGSDVTITNLLALACAAGVHHEIAVAVEVGDVALVRRRHAVIDRRSSGDQELVVQEGTAEGRVEEVIAHRVLLGEQAFWHAGGIKAAHDQTWIVGPGDEALVVASAHVGTAALIRTGNLKLLMPVAMHDVSRQRGRRDEVRQEVGGQRIDAQRTVRISSIGVEAGINHGCAGGAAERLRRVVQRTRIAVGVAGQNRGVIRGVGRLGNTVEFKVSRRSRNRVAGQAVDLVEGIAGRIGNAIGTGEAAIEAVEAPVFLVDHNDVVNAVQRLSCIHGKLEDGARSVAIRAVFQRAVLRGGVDALARHGQRLAILADVKRVVVKRVRAVEVSILRSAFSHEGAALVALHIVQAGIAHKADGFDTCRCLGTADEVGRAFDAVPIMIQKQVRAGGTERATNDREAIRHLHIGGLGSRRASGRVEHFVDAVLVVVRRHEDDVLDAIVGDELEQRIALSTVAAHVGLATIGVHRSVGAVVAVSLHRRSGHTGEGGCAGSGWDRADLIDRVGKTDKLPGGASLLGGEELRLHPGELSCAKVLAARSVSARTTVVGAAICGLQADVAIAAVIKLDVDAVTAPLLGEVLLLGAVGAGIARSADRAAVLDRLIVHEDVL